MLEVCGEHAAIHLPSSPPVSWSVLFCNISHLISLHIWLRRKMQFARFDHFSSSFRVSPSLRRIPSCRVAARVREEHMRSGNDVASTSWPVTSLLHSTTCPATSEVTVSRKETSDPSSCRHGNTLSVCNCWEFVCVAVLVGLSTVEKGLLQTVWREIRRSSRDNREHVSKTERCSRDGRYSVHK